jgi:hypothetical protein
MKLARCRGLGRIAFVLSALVALGATGCESRLGPSADEAVGVLVNGKPQGLFFMTRYWSYTSTLEKAVWYFSPDGKVYQNLVTGFSDEDLKAHQGPKGTLAISGTEMEVTWADGKKSKSALEPDKDNTFGWDGGIFTPAKPVKDPKTLVGKWDGGESLIHGGNTVSVGRTLQLNADGTFEQEGAAFVGGGAIAGGAEGKSRGTWSLEGYSLTLKQEGGKTDRLFTFPAMDEFLYIGGMMYKRIKSN